MAYYKIKLGREKVRYPYSIFLLREISEVMHLISLEQIHRNFYLFLLVSCYLLWSKYVLTLFVRLTEYNSGPLLWFSITVSLQVTLQLTSNVKANGTAYVTYFAVSQKKIQFIISSVH